jgi:hypothetical protein
MIPRVLPPEREVAEDREAARRRKRTGSLTDGGRHRMVLRLAEVEADAAAEAAEAVGKANFPS